MADVSVLRLLDWKLVSALAVLMLVGNLTYQTLQRSQQVGSLVGELQSAQQALTEQQAQTSRLLDEMDRQRSAAAADREELLRQQRELLHKIEALAAHHPGR